MGAGIVIAIGAVVGIYWHKAKRKISDKIGIDENKNKLIVEIKSQNKFEITQRILSLSNHCKVLEPQNFKEEIINHLMQMKEGYNFEN